MLFQRIKKKIRIPLSNKKWECTEVHFQRVFDLLEDLDWLLPRESQVHELFYGLLQNEEERDLITILLKKVIFLSDDASRSKISDIATHITDTWKCTAKDTIVIGAKDNNDADGSDVFVYGLRNALRWPDKRIQTNYSAIEEPAMMSEIKNIVIADDFTGSGKRMDGILKKVTAKVGSDITVRFVSIGIMPDVVKENYPAVLSFEYYAPVKVYSGFDHTQETSKTSLMTQIESYLSPKYNRLKLSDFHLGFKESGALYWNKQYRVPNNVYPVFWWGYKKDKTPYNAIMKD